MRIMQAAATRIRGKDVVRALKSHARRTTCQRLAKEVAKAGSVSFSANTLTFGPAIDGIQSASFATAPSSGTSSNEDLRRRGIFNENNLLQYQTLHELQKHATEAYASNHLFGSFVTGKEGAADGEFNWMTYKEWGDTVDRCRVVLSDLGVEEYSKVGVISNNRWEWATIAAAAYSLNATMVPMYEAQLAKDWRYIINDSECTALFCATQEIYSCVSDEVLPSTPSVKATLCFDAPHDESYSFSAAMDSTLVPDFPPGDEGTMTKLPMPDDLANLVYTSGTTGKPKGVELLHVNSCSNVKGVRGMVTDPHDFIRQSDRSLAFLPWAHSYGQTCELWGSVSQGAALGICRGVPYILEDLQLVRPTIIFSVPALYKRVFDGVRNIIEESGGVHKELMTRALDLGRRRTEAERGGDPLGPLERLGLGLLDGAVLSKIRDRFGGKLRCGFVAGAACPVEVIDFMDDIGIPVCEGYGLTETSPIITLNVPERRRAGSCGPPLTGVTVVVMGEDGHPAPVGEEGEVCCFGPNVMRGYYKRPDATAEVITLAPDGKSKMFHTGDLGRQDEEGWVQITGRLKDQYKLENGKYVCPGPVEEAICMSRFIGQAVLAGANRPHSVALVVPEWAAVRAELSIDDGIPEEELVNYESVRNLLEIEIASQCAELKKFERPRDWAVVAPFTAANDMLTPSKGSIRRHVVIRTYDALLKTLYGDEEDVDRSESSKEREEAV